MDREAAAASIRIADVACTAIVALVAVPGRAAVRVARRSLRSADEAGRTLETVVARCELANTAVAALAFGTRVAGTGGHATRGEAARARCGCPRFHAEIPGVAIVVGFALAIRRELSAAANRLLLRADLSRSAVSRGPARGARDVGARFDASARETHSAADAHRTGTSRRAGTPCARGRPASGVTGFAEDPAGAVALRSACDGRTGGSAGRVTAARRCAT